MTEAENRDQSNLLLLCFFHSRVIDQHPASYPPDLLRAWKAAAEDGVGIDPELTEAEAEQVVAISVAQEITITADVIKLGGELGGGGGAIGLGSVGGAGGPSTC